MHTRILIADEDEATLTFLGDNLSADGYEISTAKSCEHALSVLRREHFQLIVADVNGSTLRLIEHADATPIIVLGRGGEIDAIRKLERGADDYVCKPFSYPELRARVQAVLRRTSGQKTSSGYRAILGAGYELFVEPETLTAYVQHGALRHDLPALTGKEWAILVMLAEYPTRVFSKAEIVRSAWSGQSYVGSSRMLDAHACRLRGKFAGIVDARVIENIWGVGYRLTSCTSNETAAV